MLILEHDDPKAEDYWRLLATAGCTRESAHINLRMGPRVLYSVDVPETSDLNEIYDILERGEADEAWLFQEGYAHRRP